MKVPTPPTDATPRWRAVLREAWARRTETIRREGDELAFLPATLELTETPPSPLPRVLLASLCGFLVLIVLWACFGHVDIIASAQGRIVPAGNTKVLQPLDKAVVSEIHVQDGQHVQAGDLLIVLDGRLPEAERQRLGIDLATAELTRARTQALLATRRGQSLPASLTITTAAEPALRASQTALMQQEAARHQAQREDLRLEAETLRAEQATAQALLTKLQTTQSIVERRAADSKRLAEQHYLPQHEYLAQEETRQDREQDIRVQKARLRELDAALARNAQQRTLLDSEFQRTQQQALAEAEQRIAELRQEHTKADVTAQSYRLTAPVSGTVQQLAVHTVGGVVTDAQPLLIIVPDDAHLEIEATLDNKDIGFVHLNQEAEIKVETFPFTRYGTLAAKVAQLSSDAIVDEKRGLIYQARLKLNQTTMRINERTIRITPGMAVTAEIKTGQRRVIQYFLEPVVAYASESIRER